MGGSNEFKGGPGGLEAAMAGEMGLAGEGSGTCGKYCRMVQREVWVCANRLLGLGE